MKNYLIIYTVYYRIETKRNVNIKKNLLFNAGHLCKYARHNVFKIIINVIYVYLFGRKMFISSSKKNGNILFKVKHFHYLLNTYMVAHIYFNISSFSNLEYIHHQKRLSKA